MAMRRSTDRILTTHVGSLIRPAALREFLAAKEAGQPFDEAAYAKCLKASVGEVVRKQAEIGIDVISDGEFGKAISWAQYALFRLGGFERRPFAGGNPFTRGVDRTRFAEFYAELDARDKVETVMDSVVVAPIIPVRRSCSRTSTTSRMRSTASRWWKHSCRWRRRRA
jgi:5-methyltetrahydropteroyltriglutamate--homocysteine methyltransferase